MQLGAGADRTTRAHARRSCRSGADAARAMYPARPTSLRAGLNERPHQRKTESPQHARRELRASAERPAAPASSVTLSRPTAATGRVNRRELLRQLPAQQARPSRIEACTPRVDSLRKAKAAGCSRPSSARLAVSMSARIDVCCAQPCFGDQARRAAVQRGQIQSAESPSCSVHSPAIASTAVSYDQGEASFREMHRSGLVSAAPVCRRAARARRRYPERFRARLPA